MPPQLQLKLYHRHHNATNRCQHCRLIIAEPNYPLTIWNFQINRSSTVPTKRLQTACGIFIILAHPAETASNTETRVTTTYCTRVQCAQCAFHFQYKLNNCITRYQQCCLLQSPLTLHLDECKIFWTRLREQSASHKRVAAKFGLCRIISWLFGENNRRGSKAYTELSSSQFVIVVDGVFGGVRSVGWLLVGWYWESDNATPERQFHEKKC